MQFLRKSGPGSPGGVILAGSTQGAPPFVLQHALLHASLHAGLCAGLALVVGCAAPGNPLPPTLNLPQLVNVSSLHAMRAGGEVRLSWTSPSQTTDKLPIRSAITAEICREDNVPTAPLANGMPNRCQSVAQIPVVPGASSAVDTLPSALASGEPRLLAYRVQLRNASGRTAGASLPVFAVAGSAPPPLAEFSAEPGRVGIILHWKPASGQGEVEVDRTATPAAQPTAKPAPSRDSNLLGSQKQPLDIRMRASVDEHAGDAPPQDPGGMIDRTVEFGRTYTYTAQRVRTVELSGQQLELRSQPSAALTFAVRDVFPPAAPTGLAAVPAFAGDADAPRPAIDLVWEPNAEAGVAGYKIYRSEAGADAGASAWQRAGRELVTSPAWRDLAVTAGHRYAYRVTAVSTADRESQPSAPAEETAPTP
jgi:hypothetical protein